MPRLPWRGLFAATFLLTLATAALAWAATGTSDVALAQNVAATLVVMAFGVAAYTVVHARRRVMGAVIAPGVACDTCGSRPDPDLSFCVRCGGPAPVHG